MGRAAKHCQAQRLPHRTDSAQEQQAAVADQGQPGVSATDVYSSKACELTLSVLIWVLVLVCGLLPSSLNSTTRSLPQAATPYQHGFDRELSAAAVNLNSNGVGSLSLDDKTLVAQLEAAVGYQQNASWLTRSKLLLPELADNQLDTLHPDLASLLDLCPLIGTDGTQHGYPGLCDDNHYRMSCREQLSVLHATTLSKFTSACHSSRVCRAWWMQRHDIAGMSGCPITVKQGDYVKQEPSNLLQQNALVVYARLPGAASVWWWTIAVGKLTSSICCLLPSLLLLIVLGHLVTPAHLLFKVFDTYSPPVAPLCT